MKKIKKVNLYDQIVDTIIQMIESDQLEQGSKLAGEIELAASFQVSRNIMREALKILENFGILDAKNGVGTFVSKCAKENIQNMGFFHKLKENESVAALLELRLMVEPSAAQFAAMRISDQGIEELRALSNQMIHRYETIHRYQDDFDLHMAIAHYSENELCEHLIRSLLVQLQNSLYAEFNSYASDKTKRDNLDTHIAIIDAIAEHNGDLAYHLMENHLRRRLMLLNPDFEYNAL